MFLIIILDIVNDSKNLEFNIRQINDESKY